MRRHGGQRPGPTATPELSPVRRHVAQRPAPALPRPATARGTPGSQAEATGPGPSATSGEGKQLDVRRQAQSAAGGATPGGGTAPGRLVPHAGEAVPNVGPDAAPTPPARAAILRRRPSMVQPLPPGDGAPRRVERTPDAGGQAGVPPTGPAGTAAFGPGGPLEQHEPGAGPSAGADEISHSGASPAPLAGAVEGAHPVVRRLPRRPTVPEDQGGVEHERAPEPARMAPEERGGAAPLQEFAQPARLERVPLRPADVRGPHRGLSTALQRSEEGGAPSQPSRVRGAPPSQRGPSEGKAALPGTPAAPDATAVQRSPETAHRLPGEPPAPGTAAPRPPSQGKTGAPTGPAAPPAAPELRGRGVPPRQVRTAGQDSEAPSARITRAGGPKPPVPRPPDVARRVQREVEGPPPAAAPQSASAPDVQASRSPATAELLSVTRGVRPMRVGPALGPALATGTGTCRGNAGSWDSAGRHRRGSQALAALGHAGRGHGPGDSGPVSRPSHRSPGRGGPPFRFSRCRCGAGPGALGKPALAARLRGHGSYHPGAAPRRGSTCQPQRHQALCRPAGGDAERCAGAGPTSGNCRSRGARHHAGYRTRRSYTAKT